MAEPIRLAKRVAAQAGCSRREAELLIEGGWVMVDGQVVEEPPARVAEGQRVDIDPAARPEALAPVTLLLHKPPGARDAQLQQLLTAANLAPDDRSGLRPRKKHFSQLEALLPLPMPASGLAVFSQDHRIVRKLTEDARVIEQEVIVEVGGAIAPGGLALLAHGLAWRGHPLPPVKVSWQNETRLRFALKGIRPGQIPAMCEAVGLQVVAIKRIRLGRVPLAKVPEGQWRYLQPWEKF